MAIALIPQNFIDNNGAWTPVHTALNKINEVINTLEGGANSDLVVNSLTTDTINPNTSLGVNINGLQISTGGKLKVIAANITQSTNINTPVSVNGAYGVITTVGATLSAGTYTNFTVSNYLITTNSMVNVYIIGYNGGTGIPSVYVSQMSNTQCIIKINNSHPTEALNQSLRIAYQVIN